MSVYNYVYVGVVGEGVVEGFPHIFEKRPNNLCHDADLFAWCTEQFGSGWDISDGYIIKDARWIYNYRSDLAFRNAEDAFAFRMRWC